MAITMLLHPKKHEAMYVLTKLLYAISHYPANSEIHHTLATANIQRNALLDTLRRIMEITESSSHYHDILFHLSDLFPPKDYSPYNTESDLEKSLDLNKALFNLGHTLANNFIANTNNQPRPSLLKYFDNYPLPPIPTPAIRQKQLDLAEKEYSRYQRYKAHFNPHVLDAAIHFTDIRAQHFSQLSTSKNKKML